MPEQVGNSDLPQQNEFKEAVPTQKDKMAIDLQTLHLVRYHKS